VSTSSLEAMSSSDSCIALLADEDTIEATELSRLEAAAVRALYSFWPAIQSTPYKLVRFLITLAFRCMVPLETPL
jgi:hypothetical protein